MKIIVDELPERPIDCPYSEVDDVGWIFCAKGCFVCEDTKQCKFFKTISDYKVDVYGSPTYGVLIDYYD